MTAAAPHWPIPCGWPTSSRRISARHLSAAAPAPIGTWPRMNNPPIDPISRQGAFSPAGRLSTDDCCRAALADTLRLADIFAADFSAAFVCGGAGAYWDLAEDEQ